MAENAQTLAREEQRGRSRWRAGPARARASDRRLSGEGNRSGASLAPEPTGTGIGQRHMAQPHTRASGRRRQARLGNCNRDGAPGTGPPGSGGWKAWAEVSAEWMFVEVNGVGSPALFQQEALQRRTHASAGGTQLEGLIKEWHRKVSLSAIVVAFVSWGRRYRFRTMTRHRMIASHRSAPVSS